MSVVEDIGLANISEGQSNSIASKENVRAIGIGKRNVSIPSRPTR